MHRELTLRWKQVSHHKTNGSGNRSRVFSTFQHHRPLSSQNRHPSWGPRDMGDRHCEHEVAQEIDPDITRAVLSTTDAFRKGQRYVFAHMQRNLG